MAKIIDPFGNQQEDDGKDQQPDMEQLQSFVSDLMSSLGISPEDLAGVGDPVQLALLLRQPKPLSGAQVADVLRAAIGEGASVVGSRGSAAGTSVHLVEIGDETYFLSTYSPNDAENLPAQLVDHEIFQTIGTDTPFVMMELNQSFDDADEGEDELEEAEGEAPDGDGIPLFGQPIEGIGEEDEEAAAEEAAESDDEDEEDPWAAEETAMARVLAEFLDDSVESVFVLPTAEALPYSPFMKDLLRGPDPMYYFLEKEVPVREFEADDPRLLVAAEEARRRFAEFRVAFDNRDPDDEESIYAVKVPVQEGEIVEHVWLNVTEIGIETVVGDLANEPLDLEEVELGDELTVELDKVEDWLVQKGEERLGGFSLAILFGSGGEPG